MKKYIYSANNQNKADVTTVISEKIDFNAKGTEKNYIMKNG